MSLKTNISDPSTGKQAQVTAEGALRAIIDPAPPLLDREVHTRVFRQFLTADGTSTGSNDMQVTGTAANPIDFFVQADQDFDLYITALSFVIADQGAVLNEFGNIGSGLSNGCQLIYQDTRGDVFIHDALQTSFDYIRLGLGQPAFGDAATAFRANNMLGASEGYIPIVDFRATFGLAWGIPLKAGSKHRIIHRVRDTTTGVDLFNCIAYGFTRIT